MNKKNLLDSVDFYISVCTEMIPENGEDCAFYCIDDKYALVSAFDGCGGLGAKKYSNFQNKTGAYIAARAAGGATMNWFQTFAEKKPSEKLYKEILDRALKVAKSYADRGGIELKGSMQKQFPTTLTTALTYISNNALYTDFYWAGDSRGYILDEDGLHQITDDDIAGEDAMTNLTNDGVLTNVVSLTVPYTIHKKTLRIVKPSIIFCATDGCFGYMPTPMDFEYMLLDSLIVSKTPNELENTLNTRIGKFASDDYTLNMISVGFDKDYNGIKNHFEKRRFQLYNDYIKKMDGLDYDGKLALWNEYKTNYYGYSVV